MLLHACHEGVLGKVVGAAAVLVIGTLYLVLEGLDILWEKAMKLELIAFLLGKSSALVQIRRIQQSGALARSASQPSRQRSSGGVCGR